MYTIATKISGSSRTSFLLLSSFATSKNGYMKHGFYKKTSASLLGKLSLMVLSFLLLGIIGFGQSIGDYRTTAVTTMVSASGWQVYDGAAWQSTNQTVLGNSGYSQSATTTNSSTTVVLAAKNSSIRAGQYVSGTGITSGTTVSSVSQVLATTGNVTNGNNTITNVASITGVSANMIIAGAGIPPGTKVSSTSGSGPYTITMNANANGTITGTAITINPQVVLSANATSSATNTLTFSDTYSTSCTTTAGTSTVPLTNANTLLSIGMAVSGTGIAGGAIIASTSATGFTLYTPSNNANSSTTNASKTVTLGSADATINPGMYVTGAGIAAGTTVSSISGTTLTLSANAGATASGVTLSFSSVNASATNSLTFYTTQTTTSSFASGATSVTLASTNSLVQVGMTIYGTTNIQPGTYITSVSGTTIGLSLPTTGAQGSGVGLVVGYNVIPNLYINNTVSTGYSNCRISTVGNVYINDQNSTNAGASGLTPVNSTFSIGLITSGGGSIDFECGSVTVAALATLSTSNTSTANASSMEIYGSSPLSVVNGGTVDFTTTTGGSAVTNVTFTYPGTTSIATTTNTLKFNNLGVNLGGSAANKLTINAVFSLATAVSSQTLTLTSGTLDINNSATNITPWGSAATTIINTAGGLIIDGATINAVASASTGGASTVYTNNGTFTINTGTVSLGAYNSAGAAGLIQFANAATGTFSLAGGTLTIYGVFNNSGTATFSGTSTLNIPSGGALNQVSMAIFKTSGTLNLQGGNINILSYNASGTGYHEFYNSGTINATGGTVTFGGAAALQTQNGFTFWNLVIGDGSNSSSFTPGGISTVLNQLTISANGTWNNASNYGITIKNGGIANGGTFTAGTGVYTFSTGTSQALSGTLNIPSVTVTSPTVLTNNGTLTVGTALAGTGTLTQGANSTLNIGGTSAITALNASTVSNTVNFNGTGAQTIPAINYNSLTISGARASTPAITLASGTIGVSGALNVNYTSTASFTTTGNTINITGTSTSTLSSAFTSAAISVASGATLATSATFTANGAVSMNGSLQLNAGGWANGSGTWNYGTTGTLLLNNTSSYGVNSGDVFWPTTNGPINITVLQGGLTLNSGANRTVTGLFQTAAGITLSSATLTLNGTCQLNTGGYFNNTPTYGSGSLLLYNTGGTFGRGNEWNNPAGASVGAGTPASVQLSNNTTLNYPNGNNTSPAANLTGNLTVDAGSAFYMDYGSPSSSTGALTVSGNASINGNLSLGNKSGGDIYVAGNWSHGAGTFNANNRAVFLNGAAAQTIANTNSTNESFPYLIINNTSGGVTLNSPVTVSNTLTLTSGLVATTSVNLLTVTGSISGGSSTAYINGPLAWTYNTTSGNYSFPVGTASGYYNLTLNTPNTNGSNTTTVQAFTTGSSTGGTIDATLSGVGNEYWKVTTNSAYTSLGSVTLTTNTSTITTSSVVAQGNGTTYTKENTAAGGSANTVTSTGSLANGTTEYYAIGALPSFSLGAVSPTAITGVSQGNATGYYGQTVTVNGYGFSSPTPTLTIGGTSVSVTVTSNTTLTFVVPTNVSTGTLQLSQSGTNLTTSFTVLGYISNAATDWNTISTWLSNSLPTAGSTVTINNAVTVGNAVTNAPNSITINSGSSLAVNAGGTLTATTITNNGTVTTASTGILTATTFTNASGSVLNMTSGGTLSITAGGSIANNSGTFTYGTGTINFAGAGTFTGITNFYNASIGGGVNFSGTTINGTLQINSGGYVNTTAPTYATGSTLQYNTGGTYGRTTEWITTTGAGYPYSVQVSNNTILDIGANSGGAIARQIAGNLTIDNGSTLTMAGGTSATGSQAMNAALTVGGYVSNSGTLTLSGSLSGDIYVAGNWTNTGTFTPNSRAVFFNGSTTSTVNNGSASFDYLLISKSSGTVTVTLAANTTVNQDLTLTTGKIDYSSYTLTVAGNLAATSGTITTASTGNITMTGNGKTIAAGLTVGNLTINGTSPSKIMPSGSLSFASGSTLNVAAGDTLDMGTNTMSATVGNFTNTGTGAIKIGGTFPFSYTTPYSWSGWMIFTSATGFYTIYPGNYNNIDLDYSSGVSRNLDAGSGVGNGTFSISGQMKWSGNGSISSNKTTISVSATATIPYGITYYNLTFTGATAPTFSGGNGSTISVGNVFNPGTVTSVTGATTFAFTGPNGGGVQVGSQTIPAINYNNLSISGSRGGGTGITGTTISGSNIVYSTSVNTSLANGSTVTGTGIPASTTLTGYSTATTTTGSFTGVVYSGNAKIITNTTGVTISSSLTNMYGLIGSQNLYVASENSGVSNVNATLTAATNPTITLSSTTGLTAGMTITSTGTGTVSAGATITSVSGNNITISGTTTSGSATLSFSGIITMNAAITATGTTSFQFYPAYLLSNNATASATVSDIVVQSALIFASGTIGVAGNFSDSHSGTINTVTSTGSTINMTGNGTLTTVSDSLRCPLSIANNNTVTAASNQYLNATLTVASGATLNLAGYALYAGQSFTNAGTGTIQTQSTSTTPITAGKTWTGTLQFNNSAVATQYIVAGTYNNLDISNTGTSTRTLTNGATININGNYTPNTTGITNTTGSTVIFNGTGTQSINGGATFYNLQINKTGTTNPLNLLGTVKVGTINTGTLTLTSGRVVGTNSAHITLVDTIPSSLSGGSSTAYIDGVFKRYLRAGNTGYLFPVGNYVSGDNYFPDTLTSIATTDSISVSAFLNSGTLTPDNSTISSVDQTQYWVVRPTVNNTIAMSLVPASLGSSITVGELNTSIGQYYSKGGTIYNNNSINASSIALTAGNDSTFALGITSIPIPTISSISADLPIANGTSMYPGTTLTISGNNLTNNISSTTVTVGGQNASILSSSSTSLIITVPTRGTSGLVVVNTGATPASITGTYDSTWYVSIANADWNTTSTWFTNEVPGNTKNVFVKNTVGMASNNGACNNLTIASSGVLNLGTSGTGTVTTQAALSNSGTINIGLTTITGILTVTGNTTNTSTGVINVGVAGGSYSRFFMKGASNSNAGTITVANTGYSTGIANYGALNNTGTITASSTIELDGASAAVTGNAINWNTGSYLSYNNGTSVTPGAEWTPNTASNVPTNVFIGSANIAAANSGSSVNLTGNNWTIGGQLRISATSTETISNGNSLTLNSLADSGTLNIGTSTLTSLASTATSAALILNSGSNYIGTLGTLNVYGYLKLGAGLTIQSGNGNTGTFNLYDYSVYEHAYNSGTVTTPTTGWPSHSLLYFSGIATGAPTGITQNFANVVWNAPNQTNTLSLTGFTNISGYLNVINTGAYPYYVRFTDASKSYGSLQVGGSFAINGTTITSTRAKVDLAYNAVQTTVVIGGGVTIGSGDTLLASTSNGTTNISIAGDFTNNGTLTNNTTNITFNGASAQNIIGNTNFKNLTINNASGITLSGVDTVSGTLTLTSGKVKTTSSNTLLVSSTSVSSISGGSSTAYIDGPLSRAVASGSNNYSFPVGQYTGVTSYYLPDTITATTAIDTITVTAFKSAPSGATFDGTLTGLSSNEYWTVNSIKGNTVGLTISPYNYTYGSSYNVVAQSSNNLVGGQYTSNGGIPTNTSIAASSILLPVNTDAYFTDGQYPNATISSVQSCIPGLAAGSFYAADTLTITGNYFQTTTTVKVGGQNASIVDNSGVPTTLKVLVANSQSLTNTIQVGTASTTGAFKAGYVTRYDGVWNNGAGNNPSLPNYSIWLGGVQPAGAGIVATINNAVTLASSISGGNSLSSLTINSGSSFAGGNVGIIYTSSSSPYPSVTIVNNGTFSGSSNYTINGSITNNGTFNFTGGSYTFNGNTTVGGTNSATFYTINTALSGTLTFNKAATINGNLTLNAGWSVAGNAPTYANVSTLTYNTGTAATPGSEWLPNVSTSGAAGCPAAVAIGTSSGGATGSTVSFVAGNTYTHTSSLTINNGYTLTIPENVTLASGNGITVASGGTLNIGTTAPTSSLATFGGSGNATYSLYNGGTFNIAGTVNLKGYLKNALTNTITQTGTLNVSDYTVYEHAANGGSLPYSGTAASPTAWQPNSLVSITGLTSGSQPTLATLQQTFGNLTWNTPNSTTWYTLATGNNFAVTGTLSVLSTGSSSSRYLLLTNTGSTNTIGSLSIGGGSNKAYLNVTNLTNLATINVGDVTLASNGYLGTLTTGSNTSTVNIAGNWNSSNATPFNSNNALINFSGSGSAQTITGATTFNSVSINNASGVSLVSATTIANSLTLSNGKLDVGSNNLTLNSGVTVSSASSSSYIVTSGSGRLVRKAVSSATSLPVGTSTSYAPVTITNNTASDMTVGVSSSITNTVFDNTKMINLQWSIAAATATTNSSVVYQFNSADGGSSFSTATACQLGIYTSSYAISNIGIPTANGGTYTLTKSALAFGANTTYLHVLGNVNGINSCTPGSYVGINGGDASLAGNWCGGLPTSVTDVIIATNVPSLNSNLSVNNLDISSGLNLNGYTLTVNGAVSGTGTITGSATSGLNMVGTGTLYFDQSTPGTTNTLDTFIVNSGGTVSLGNALNIVSLLQPTAGVLASGGNLTLLSSLATGTARVSKGATNGGYITGKVTQQLYIPSKTARRYSFVGSSIAQRIDSAWQQQVYITGVGTGGTICGTGGAQFNSNGFDATTASAPSMNTYNATAVNGSRYVSVPNTNATSLTPGIGYEMNIRGDRNTGSCADQLNSNTPTAPVDVVLSATGLLTQGPVTVPLNDNTKHLFTLLANPYPSQIRFSDFQASNSAINNKMWSYSHYGNGNYTTYSNGLVTNPASGYDDNKGDFIAVGQAFFVESNTSGTSVTFNEAHKVDSTIPNFNYFGVQNQQIIKMGIYSTANARLDEVAIRYNKQGTKTYNTQWDAITFGRSSQSMSIQKTGGYSLAIATRPIGLQNDTVHLTVTSSTQGSFKLRFTGFTGFDSSSNIVLVDNLLGVRQSVTANPVYDFAITADTNSKGTNRFVLEISTANPLPVTLTSLSGKIVNSTTELNWGVANEDNTSSYIVEKSTDGATFNAIATVKAANKLNYSTVDRNPVEGVNYYRIKAVDKNGSINYSKTIQVSFKVYNNNQISVYPTLIANHSFNIKLASLPTGNYKVSLYDMLGKTVFAKTLQTTAGEETRVIDFGNNRVATGAYEVVVTDGAGRSLNRVKVVVE